MSHQSFEPESLNDALIECVKAAGGSKVVGNKLFPEKMVDAAQRHLLNCLQDGWAEHLKPDQVAFVFKLAREHGSHVGMAYLCQSLGYAPPVPLQPVDAVAQLQREFIEATRELSLMAARIEVQQASMSTGLKVVS